MQASVEAQLLERREQKKLEAALKLQEEQGAAAEMAAELKAKMEASILQFLTRHFRQAL